MKGSLGMNSIPRRRHGGLAASITYRIYLQLDTTKDELLNSR